MSNDQAMAITEKLLAMSASDLLLKITEVIAAQESEQMVEVLCVAYRERCKTDLNLTLREARLMYGKGVTTPIGVQIAQERMSRRRRR